MAHCYHFSLVCILLTAQDNDLLDVGAYLTNTLEKLPLSIKVSKPDYNMPRLIQHSIHALFNEGHS